MTIERADVEALLATLEEVHKPNHGVIAQLCRTWLAVDSAPIVKVRGKVGEFATIVVSHGLCGQRIRLLALDSGGSKGGGSLPPPLGGGDGG